MSKPATVLLSSIVADPEIQPRAELDTLTVAEYAADMLRGDTFPPIEVMSDGEASYLFCGFHRFAAAQEAEHETILAIVHEGTRDDAIWRSLATNQTHGLRRSNADKRRAVESALLHENGAKMSDRAIAEHVGVHHVTVGNTRKEMTASGEIHQIETRTVTRNGTTYEQNTANIGATTEEVVDDSESRDEPPETSEAESSGNNGQSQSKTNSAPRQPKTKPQGETLYEALEKIGMIISGIRDQYGSATEMFESDQWKDRDHSFVIAMFHALRRKIDQFDTEVRPEGVPPIQLSFEF